MDYDKKKPYDKMPLKELHQNESTNLFIDTHGIGSDNRNTDSLFTDDSKLLSLDEPNIVKELRKEEREGKLFIWPPGHNDHIAHEQHVGKEPLSFRKVEPKNYNEAFLLAKKALKDLENL